MWVARTQELELLHAASCSVNAEEAAIGGKGNRDLKPGTLHWDVGTLTALPVVQPADLCVCFYELPLRGMYTSY